MSNLKEKVIITTTTETYWVCPICDNGVMRRTGQFEFKNNVAEHVYRCDQCLKSNSNPNNYPFTKKEIEVSYNEY